MCTHAHALEYMLPLSRFFKLSFWDIFRMVQVTNHHNSCSTRTNVCSSHTAVVFFMFVFRETFTTCQTNLCSSITLASGCVSRFPCLPTKVIARASFVSKISVWSENTTFGENNDSNDNNRNKVVRKGNAQPGTEKGQGRRERGGGG